MTTWLAGGGRIESRGLRQLLAALPGARRWAATSVPAAASGSLNSPSCPSESFSDDAPKRRASSSRTCSCNCSILASRCSIVASWRAIVAARCSSSATNASRSPAPATGPVARNIHGFPLRRRLFSVDAFHGRFLGVRFRPRRVRHEFARLVPRARATGVLSPTTKGCLPQMQCWRRSVGFPTPQPDARFTRPGRANP